MLGEIDFVNDACPIGSIEVKAEEGMKICCFGVAYTNKSKIYILSQTH